MKKNIFKNFCVSTSNLKTLFILLIIPFFVFTCSSYKEIKKPPVFKVVKTTLAKDVQDRGTQGVPRGPTNSFTIKDEEVFSYIKYENLWGKHHLRWEWYRPDGKLYYNTKNYPIETSKNTYVKEGSACHKISIKGTKAEKYLGNWRVKVFLDNKLYTSNYFKIIKGKKIEKIAQVPTVDKGTIFNFMGIEFGNYYALVIGNQDYYFLPKLESAKNDAEKVAQTLQKYYGFNVKLLLNATRADILMALSNMRSKLGDQDNLLIYYAGHGWLDEEADEGYWLPVDAEVDNQINWVSNSSISTTLKAMRAKHVLVVADSCFSGKLTRGIRVKIKTQDYLSKLAKKRARTVLTSGGLEPVADSGGKGGHSVFTAAFLSVLKDNESVIDGTEIYNKIQRPVKLNSDQTPAYSDIRKAGHEGGDFLFVKKVQSSP